MNKELDNIGLERPESPDFGSATDKLASIDDLIRATYTSNPNFTTIDEFAKSIGKPRWWVSRRAGELGLARPRLASAPWTKAETDIVDRLGDAGIAGIAAGLKAVGFSRSLGAVAMEMKKQMLSRTPRNAWSARTLAEFMGVNSKTVARWIDAEGLPAEREGNAWRVQRVAFKAWLACHRTRFDLRKVDQEWFLALLLDD